MIGTSTRSQFVVMPGLARLKVRVETTVKRIARAATLDQLPKDLTRTTLTITRARKVEPETDSAMKTRGVL